MKNPVEKYESELLSEILSQISPEQQAETDRKMLQILGAADGMKRKGQKKETDGKFEEYI